MLKDESKETGLYFGRNVLREALIAKTPVEEIFYESEPALKFLESLKGLKSSSIKKTEGIPGSMNKYSHQGIVFRSSHKFYSDIASLALPKLPFVVVCNHMEDVHNLGSVIRCAAGFGAKLIIHEEKESASLTPAAVKSSAGLAFHLRFAKTANLPSTLQKLAQNGFHIIGLDAGARSLEMRDWIPQFPLALVLGSEGEGLSPAVQARCESLVRIKTEKILESLNVSHAAAIAMQWAYENSQA